MVPLYLTPASKKVQVGSISAAITFDSKLVSFVNAEKGYLLDAAKGSFHTEVKKSAVLVEVTAQGEEGKPLQEGLVLVLVFRISPDAPLGREVSLRFEKVSATDLSTPPKAIEPLSGGNAAIAITGPDTGGVVEGCFFFTH